MIADAYTIEPRARSYAVWHEHFGYLAEDIASYGEAESFVEDHEAEQAERRRTEEAGEDADNGPADYRRAA